MRSRDEGLNGSDAPMPIGAFRRRPGRSGAACPGQRARLFGGIGPRVILGTLFSFELLFVLFLSAGRYKGDPRLAWVPIDLTGLFWAASVVVGGWLMCCRARINTPALYATLAMFLFSSWVSLTLLWTPSTDYAATKAVYIATLVTWAYVGAACVIAPEPARVWRFFALSAVFGVCIAAEVVAAYVGEDPESVVHVLGSDTAHTYIGVGRTVGLAALLLCVFLVWGPRGLPARGCLLAGLLLCLFSLLVAGARGPIASFAIALAVVFLVILTAPTSPWRISRRVKATVACVALSGLVAVAAVPFVFEDVFARTAGRFAALWTESEGDASAGARLWAWNATLPHLKAGPLAGYGVGSWPTIVSGYHPRDYPHNIVLEVFFELGLIGVIMVGGLVGWALVRLSRIVRQGNPGAVAALLGLSFMLMNAMVSGDVPDNRILFTFIGLGAAYPLVRRGAQ